ncbi:MAG: tetratricopeptide repeat protein [Bacteroidetes bacterium]|nr:tetratricopeptide repeat protein [Bacteroidota bacterium]
MRLRQYLLISFLLFNQLFCISQDRTVDSLKNELAHAKEDIHKLELLNTLIESINEDNVWSKYNDILGILSQKLMLSEDAVIKLKAKKHYADFLNNRGYIYNNLGDISTALDYFHKSMKIQEEVKDKLGLAYSLNNVGFIYNSQGDLVRALDYYKKSLKLREEINDKMGISQSLNNIGNLFEQTGDKSKALRYFYQSLRIREAINDKLGQGYSLQNIGNIYSEQNNNAKALDFFTKSLKIRKEINDEQGIAYSLYNLGELYLKENKVPQALENALASLAVSNKIGYPSNIGAAANLLQEVYKKQNKYDKAYDMLKLANRMTDSLTNSELQKTSVKKQFQYEFEKKEVVAKVEQEKKDIKYNEQINQNKIIIISVGIVLLVVLLFSFFLYRRIKLIQKQNFIIESQKLEVDKQREIAINRSVVAERQKEIIELHQKEIVDSINYAKRIQYALLANESLLKSSLPEHFVLFKPKDIVSGDFYWATEHNDNFYLAVCDSTGHGVPGAFMSLLNINFLNEAVIEKNILQPNKIFDHVRIRLIEHFSQEGGRDGMDAILICINKITKKITYSAANNAPIVVRDNKVIEMLKDKMPVGKGEKTDSFSLFDLEMESGDVLYLYTDGYADQFGGPDAKKFKNRQLNDFLTNIHQLSTKEQVEKLNSTYENWRTWFNKDGEKCYHDQVDDICIIGIKI